MEDYSISILMLGLLCLTALVAGFIDTLVGGGGLLTIPALMFAGVPPIYALGTNKLQAVVGSGTAALTLFSLGKVSFSQVKWLMLAAFIGSLVGSVAVQFFDAEMLNIAIPSVIVMIGLYFLFAPTNSLAERQAKIGESMYRATAVPGIGFYDGMFGPATGSFFVLAGVSLRGQEIVNATVIAKTLNFATNLASLIVFVSFGKVLLLVGVVMMLGQFVGASIGARTLLTINPALLRYLVIILCFAMLILWANK